jgi:hypothetical protein
MPAVFWGDEKSTTNKRDIRIRRIAMANGTAEDGNVLAPHSFTLFKAICYVFGIENKIETNTNSGLCRQIWLSE